MFEKASEIRARQREKMLRKAREKGEKDALARVRRRMQSVRVEKDQVTGRISLSLEDWEYLLGDRGEAAGGR